MTLSRRQFLTLSAAALALPAQAQAQAHARQADHLFHWRGGGPFFGGFSGIALTEDRNRALLLSDRGFLLRVRLFRGTGGQITGVEPQDFTELADAQGRTLRGPVADAEGIDLRPDGSILVAFEGGRSGRVLFYADPRDPASPLPRAESWRRLPGNQSLEALAVDAQGAVHVLPEAQLDGGFPLYRLASRQSRDWEIIARLPARDGFAPVGMDFGPDGNLYLLERRFRLAFFANRISRIMPGRWESPETLVQTRLGTMDNHEGISVTRDARGQLWATTVSDDNQHPLQRTELAEFRLP